MKTCKYCKESISTEASKCPKCQSYQSFWRQPLFLAFAMIPLWLMLPYLILPSMNDRADFADHADKIILTVLSKDTLHYGKEQETKYLNILVEVENKTEEEWQHADYEIEYYSKEGKLVNVERESGYSFKLRPHSTGKTSIKVPLYQDYPDSEVIVKLDNMEPTW